MTVKKQIAVVDDHTMFRKGLVALIDLFDEYEVAFDAPNGKAFIGQLRPENLPDIILLDIAMPEMDGYATAAWLQKNHSEIPVLVLSTMDAETAIIKMIRNGAKGYILKDAEPRQLKQAFKNVLTEGYHYNEIVPKKLMVHINNMDFKNAALPTLVKLSDRELEFLKLACSEKSYAEIAKEMFVSERTIDGYRDSLFRKLSIGNRVGLAMYAIKNQIVVL